MRKRLKKWVKVTLISVISVILIMAVAFGIYLSDYYHAGEIASAILTEETVVSSIKNGYRLDCGDSKIGFIFYPGGKVESTSYLPLMKKLCEQGINCFLVDMPFNIASFGYNRAKGIIEAHPEIEEWYIGGHSLGGVFASSYASKHQDTISGVILLGAYVYGGYPPQQALTIYGSNDEILNLDRITYEDNVYIIEGGNHVQFGDYGEQKGDGKATITANEQCDETVRLIMDFINRE